MKIMIKKQQNLLMLSISLSLGAISIMKGDIQQEASLSAVNSIKANEHAVIAVGKASYGESAITGRACIVMKRKELKKICKGDIVITPAIHSTWYAELSLAAAIVTEKQDDNSHARGYGKKFEIPIIVGADGVTKKIVDGQIIMCDPIQKTVYHISYPESAGKLCLPIAQDVSAYQLSFEDNKKVTAHYFNKDNKAGVTHYSKKENGYGVDTAAVSCKLIGENDSELIDHEKPSKNDGITKDSYCFDLPSFKKYVFDMRFWLNGVRSLPFFADKALESGAKRNGCDPFAIDCIPLSFHLFDQSDSYINTILQSAVEYIDYADPMLQECNQKPGDLNWVARVCHKRHIEAIASDLPLGITKEELIADPKKYRNVDKKMNSADREKFTKKRDLLTALGLYIRFHVEGKKLSKKR